MNPADKLAAALWEADGWCRCSAAKCWTGEVLNRQGQHDANLHLSGATATHSRKSFVGSTDDDSYSI